MTKEDLSLEKQEFNKRCPARYVLMMYLPCRYMKLLLTLVQADENSWGFSRANMNKKSYQ